LNTKLTDLTFFNGSVYSTYTFTAVAVFTMTVNKIQHS